MPPDLVSVEQAGVAGRRAHPRGRDRGPARHGAAAAENGTPIDVSSPYRGYQEQVAIFNG